MSIFQTLPVLCVDTGDNGLHGIVLGHVVAAEAGTVEVPLAGLADLASPLPMFVDDGQLGLAETLGGLLVFPAGLDLTIMHTAPEAVVSLGVGVVFENGPVHDGNFSFEIIGAQSGPWDSHGFSHQP